MYERFVSQFDGCTYVSSGLNCTCGVHAMWLYRASQGRISRTSCSIRRQTNDTVGGTHLGQMETVSLQQGITGGVIWRPGRFARMRELILTGRYGAHMNGGYALLANTQWDAFRGGFRGAHDFYISRGDNDHARVGDPGANGRYPGVPTGYQNMPWDFLERVAGDLPLSSNGPTLAQEYGSGTVYTYLTPADPIVTLKKFRVVIDGNTTTRRTPLYAAPNGTRAGAVSDASYIVTQSKVNGLWWYRIVKKANGDATANAGKFFKPNGWMEWTAL